MNDNFLRIVDANENNLKSINVGIPLNKFVVFAGKSGSGKSTLAIDVIYQGYFNKTLNYNIPLKPFALFQRVDIPDSEKTTFEYIQTKNEDDSISKISDYSELLKDRAISVDCLEEIIKLIGLDEIGLKLPIKSLSLGQFQKVRLLKMLLSIKDERLLILDEPAIGLTYKEAEKLAIVCKMIVKSGFSLIVIEHSLPMIANCDFVVEFGPDAGFFGGQVIFNGNIDSFMKSQSELAKAIKENKVELIGGEEILNKFLRIQPIKKYEFAGGEICLPIGKFTCLAGKTGTGKSACLDILYRACDKSAGAGERRKGIGEIKGKNQIRRPYIIDQSPIGNHPSSIPATYINIMDTIRDVFCEKQTGPKRLTKSEFSFNSDGKCKACNGLGYLKNFIDDEVIFTKCVACNGLRYHDDILKAKVKGYSIGEILSKTCDELLEIDLESSIIFRKLAFIKSVGLSYLCIGQPSNTLSGGEAQRLKISKELSKRLGDRCVYILDTPSRGLHISNIEAVLNSLKVLVGKNNTVVIAENNPYFIRACDWLVYLDKDDKGNHKVTYQGKPQNASKAVLMELGM